MKIDPNIATSAIANYKKIHRAEKKGDPISVARDKIEISDRARIYATLLKEKETPDHYDEAKVAEIKARIAAGNYKVDARSIAEKMIGGKADG